MSSKKYYFYTKSFAIQNCCDFFDCFFFFLDFSCLPVVKKWRDTVDECIAVCECIFLMQKSFALIRKQEKVNSTVIAQDSPNYTSYVQIGLKLFSL